MKKMLFVDGIEDDIVRLIFEDGEKVIQIPLALLPEDLVEGEWLEFDISKAKGDQKLEDNENFRRELLGD